MVVADLQQSNFFKKRFPVAGADGDFFVFNLDEVAIDKFYLFQCNNIGAMDSRKIPGRQFFYHPIHTLMKQVALLTGLDADIFAHTFNV